MDSQALWLVFRWLITPSVQLIKVPMQESWWKGEADPTEHFGVDVWKRVTKDHHGTRKG